MSSGLELIVVYAGYGDTLLLKTPDTPPKYWLIDGGPVSPFPSNPVQQHYETYAYYQFLKRALRRFCIDQGKIKLSGIIITHPHKDHVAGLIQLIEDWLPILPNLQSQQPPLDLPFPVIMNATCLKRRPPIPKPLYDERDYQFDFAKVLALRGFTPSLLAQNLLPSMINDCLVDCYEMTQGTGPGSYYLPGNPADSARSRPVPGLDTSKINWRSIITMWTEPPGQELRLVTTGDAMGIDILPMMKSVDQRPDLNLGIFKVPHHGSKLNSQLENSVTEPTIEREKNHVFLLAMLVQEYINQNPIPNPNLPNDNLLRPIHVNDLQEPRDEWAAMAKKDNVDILFDDFLFAASGAICDYLTVRNFTVDPSIDLSTPGGRETFAVMLAERETKKKGLLLRSADGKVDFEQLPNLIDRMKSNFLSVEDPRRRIVKKFNLQDTFQQLENYTRNALLKLTMKLLSALRNALFANEINSLHIAKFIANFYRTFTATNYVISANGEHNHPNASTIAGIMAACLMDSTGLKLKPQPSLPSRLFVTSGYSVQLDYVRNIVKLLLEIVTTTQPPQTPPDPPKWKGWITLFCLYEDYLMAIPLDNSTVSGTTEITFPSSGIPQGDELTMLHKQFQSAKAYDIPRAAVSAHSTFHLIVEDPITKQQHYLTIDANKNFELVTDNSKPLFNIVHTGHYGPRSSPIFKLSNSHNLANEIMFHPTSLISTAGPTSRISTVGPPPSTLCYGSTPNPSIWFDPNPAPAAPAVVITKRVGEKS